MTNNCAGSEPCAGTQKICVGNGPNKGFGCLDGTQCADAAPCDSTGRVCAAGTYFAGYSCGDDADCCIGTTCPQGACVAPMLTATPTRAVTPSPTPLRTALTAPPGDGGRLYKTVAGGGCSTDAGPDRSSFAVLFGALVVWAVRQRRDA